MRNKVFMILTVALVFVAGCKKSKELSQEERERTEPLASNEFIEDDIRNEHGGIRFFLTTSAADIELSSSVPMDTTVVYSNYAIDTDVIPHNSEIIIWAECFVIRGPGTTTDILIEGFTHSPGVQKRVEFSRVPIKIGKVQFIRVKCGIIKYTFTLL